MEIRWGIVGCGAVCEVKSGPAFSRVPNSRLVAVTRRDRARAEDYARRHGVPHVLADARALVEHPEVDAVYVATPPGTHVDIALLACAAKKPTYVEKPIARSAAEARRMVEAFEAAGVPLFVAYYRRALPRFAKARELVARAGTITGVSCRFASPVWRELVDPPPWRVVAEHAGGGLFMDLACHTLDVLDMLVGPLRDVSGDAANVASPYEVEDVVPMRFRTSTGAPGVALWDFAASRREDLVEIFGTSGRVSFATFGADPLLFDDEKHEIENPPHIQEPLIATIVDELLGRGRCPSTGRSALRTAEVMDAALASFYGGRDDDFWARPDRWPGRRNRRL
ncbi:MAG TPA: Gfo/Idh/MocA family oxidoreductase [Labilithrix sp.]